MNKAFLYYLVCVATVLSFARCAQIVPLTGGKKDVTPPKLMHAVPSLNSTRFNVEEILLVFDEFVQLKDLSNQLIVSPRLKSPLEISASGKKVIIKLIKEELKANTTYRIYLGKAIADMTESNSIENFEYVFSTGNEIDSLQLHGLVQDAFTNAPSIGITVGLYPKGDSNDSIPYLEKPAYISRSNDAGEFHLKNLPSSSFYVYGISDFNKNGTFDPETEKIAFLNEALLLKKDSNILLKLFQEEPSKVFIKKTSFPVPGSFQVILNKASYTALTALHPSEQQLFAEKDPGKLKDSILVFYRNLSDTLSLLLFHKNKNTADTLNQAIPKVTSGKRKIKNIRLNTFDNKLALDGKLKIIFPNWMDTSAYDKNKIKLYSAEDTSTRLQKGKWTSVNEFEWDAKLKQGLTYELKLDSNAYFDMNRSTNDTLSFKFMVHGKSDFGKVRLNLKLNKKQAYIIQLVNEQNQISKEQFIQFSLSSSNATSIDFIDVTPGNYIVKIIFDDNNNKKWDRGEVLSKKMPEQVIINSKQLKILSDWEIEEEISVRE